MSYTADALNRYTAVGAISPSYDTNGNLTSDGTFTLGYDAENRLTSASGAGNTAAYTYDSQGRRKTRTVNGTTTVSVTDANNREVLEYDGTSGAIQRWYSYALGPNDVLNLMNVVAGTRATLLPDILGSIIASQDSSSGALTKVGYLPYGKSASTGPFGFTGQRVDPELNGYYYYRARHYSPAWGRFLQVDPIGYSGGSNLYSYVNNDPLDFVDSAGLWGFVVSFGGQVEGGLPPFGQAGGQFSQNFAFLVNTSQWSLSNPLAVSFSVVSYQSYGGVASLGAPNMPSGVNNMSTSSSPFRAISNSVADNGGGMIVGAYGGGGVSLGLTNANTSVDFNPSSATTSVNVGLGLELGGQYSTTSSGTWVASASIPFLSYGEGAAVSMYQTNSSVQRIYGK